MKTILYKVSCLIFIFVSLASCSEDEIKTYDGIKSGLMIQELYSFDQYGNPISYRDSSAYSFSGAPENTTEMNVRIVIRTMGPTVDFPRPYTLKVVAEETTAIQGEDFNLDDNDFTVQPYQASDTVLVTLQRTAKLRKQTLRIRVKIEPNEYFEVPIQTYKNSSSWSVDGPANSATSYLIKFSEQYTKPSYWTNFGESFFGPFSSAKFVALNNLMGWSVRDWQYAGSPGYKVAYGKLDFAARAFQKHLQALADAGTPLLDDDGTYMQLAADYAVDYSKYDKN